MSFFQLIDEKEVTINPCDQCDQGYSWSAYSSTKCYRIDKVPAIPPNPSNVWSASPAFSSSYSVTATRFYQQNGYNLNGTAKPGFPPYQSTTPTVWRNNYTGPTDGPMNRCAVWTTVRPSSGSWQPTDIWLGFSRCFEVTGSTRIYYFGVAADNLFRAVLDGTEILNTSGGPYDPSVPPCNIGGGCTLSFIYWHVYPIILTPGFHTLELYGLNIGLDAGFGCTIYDATFDQLTGATTVNQVKSYEILTSSGQTFFEIAQSKDNTGSYLSSGYTCPSGYRFAGNTGNCQGCVKFEFCDIKPIECCRDYKLFGGNCRYTWFKVKYCDGTEQNFQVWYNKYQEVSCVDTITIFEDESGVSQGCGEYIINSDCKCCPGKDLFCTPTQTLTQTPTPTLTPTPSITPTPTPKPKQKPIIDLCSTDVPIQSIRNECDIITIFNMNIECQVNIKPTSKDSLNGSLSILISGGTPPYTIQWGNGIVTSNDNYSTLNGLSAGTYNVIVSDFYGDFVETASCVLPALPVTPTPTQTLTPSSISYGNMCVIVYLQDKPHDYIYFIYDGMVDGKPKWKSTKVNFESNTSYTITYFQENKWKLNGLKNGLYGLSSSQPPNTNWTIYGSETPNPSYIKIISNAGECGFFGELNVPYGTLDEPCAAFFKFGEVPPPTSYTWYFEYSVNSGSGNYSIEFHDDVTGTWKKLHDFTGPSNGSNLSIQFDRDLPDTTFDLNIQYYGRIRDTNLELNSPSTPFYVCGTAF